MQISLVHRLLPIFLLVGLLAFTFGFTLYAPARVTAASCAEDAGNLLKNGTMAGGNPNSFGVVASKWKAFVVGATQPNFENALNEGYDPNGSQYIWRDFDAWDAGIYQKVTTLTAGQNYHFWMVWGQALHDIAGNNARATLINRQLGVDPTGGTDPTSPNVQWTVPYYGGGGFNRAEWHLRFTATSSTATFFLRAQNGHTDGRNKVFFDTACLSLASGEPTSTPWTPTTVPPTNTPSLTPTALLGAIEDTDANITYRGGWKTANDTNATNSIFHYARGKKGAAVIFQYAFTGTEVTIRYIGLNNRGKAKVFVDGVRVGVMDQYRSTLTYQASQTFGGFTPGAHVLKVKNAGAKNASSTDSFITLDALQFSTGTETVLAQKDVVLRVTPTPKPKRQRRTPTPYLPPPAPFQDADPPAPTPSDPSVIWDARLPLQNVYLDPASVSAGTPYWKLIRAEYEDGTQSGGKHNMYYVVTNEQGAPVANQNVWQSWPEDSTSTQTGSDGRADIAMWSNYWPHLGPGPYNGYVGGLPSDVVRGMGLPGNNHVNFILYFQKTVKSGAGGPTNTSTATPTATVTRTDTPTATHTRTLTPTDEPSGPTNTPSPTNKPPTDTPPTDVPPTDIPPTDTPTTDVVVDDSDGRIAYRGAWNGDEDERAFNGTYQYGRGVKGRALVLTYRFTGTEITIRYIGFSNRGKAKVMVDGVQVGVLDQYNLKLRYNRLRSFTNLPPGEHTLKLKSTGAKRPDATDSVILIDALESR